LLAIGADLRVGRGELRLERLDVVLVRRRVDRKQDVPLLHGPVVFDRHLDHSAAHLRDHRDDVLHDAHVAGRRRVDVQQEQQRGDRDDRKDEDRDLPRRRPRQPLQLDEDQPDEERIDAEKEDFHYAAPRPAALLASSASMSARIAFSSSAGSPCSSSLAGRSCRPSLWTSSSSGCSLSWPYAILCITGFEYAQSQANGQRRPPKTSDSRHSVRIASNCGWLRLCAICSGRMWTSQNATMRTTGTTKITKIAMNVARESSSSGDRNDAISIGQTSPAHLDGVAEHELQARFRGQLEVLFAAGRHRRARAGADRRPNRGAF